MPNIHGDFIWYELMTTDGAAQAFYGPMLGWRFGANDEYREIEGSDVSVGGILQLAPDMTVGSARPGWVGYDQAETDRYWNAIVGNGGAESACGWCKDKWGVNWQITPRVLTEAMAKGGDTAKRAFEAMMTMKKIDVAAIEAAVRG